MSSENIRASVDKAVSSGGMAVRQISKDDDGPADKQVLIRTTESDRERWKSVAETEGVTLSSWIRETLNNRARTVLECDHPMNMTRFLPWATMCTKCGRRIN